MHRIKKIAGIAAATLAGIAILAWILAFVFEDRVKTLVVQSVNSHLKAAAKVGSIHFSLLSGFPYATLTFRDVVIEEPQDFQTTGTVLTAQTISFHFSPTSLFGNNLRLRKLEMNGASLNLQVAENGTTNYEIWKSSESGEPGAFRVELQKVLLNDVRVLYYQAGSSKDIAFHLEEGVLAGDFMSDKYQLNSTGKFSAASVVFDRVKYLTDASGNLALNLVVDKPSGLYTFQNSTLGLKGLKVAIDGTVTSKNGETETNLKISSPGAGLPELLALLPQKYMPSLKGYRYSGQATFNGIIRGRTDRDHVPFIHFDFGCSQVSLKPPESTHELRNLSCKGSFTNRKSITQPVSWLKIENLQASLDGKPLQGSLELERFEKPRVLLDARFESTLQALQPFFLPDTIQEVSGGVFADIHFEGIAGEKQTYRSAGEVRFENAGFRIRSRPLRFTACNGTVNLHNNDLEVRHFSGKAGSSDFDFTGSFSNLFGWIFDERQPLKLEAIFHADRLVLDEWVTEKNAGSDSSYRFHLSPRLEMNLDIAVNQLNFRKFSASGIHGSVAMRNRVFETRNLNLETVGGSIRMAGTLDNRIPEKLQVTCTANVMDLDINKLFYEMGNFGQTVLTDRHLRGRVTSDVYFRCAWNDRLEADGNAIFARAAITINEGELIRFEPMLALSGYLKGSNLQTIQFSTLTNTIEIRDRKIFIPAMEINSSAADIKLSGEHTFDNLVDYKLQLYLSQILGKKVREQNTEFGQIEDDGVGRPMIFLTMKGPVSDPKFAWDRKGVEHKITRDIQKEARNLKQVLREEFGSRDTNQNKSPLTRKKEELQLDFETDGE